MANTITYGAGASSVDTESGLWARVGKALADYRLYRSTLDELRSLSDRELADLGLSRLSIRDIAYESVYGD